MARPKRDADGDEKILSYGDVVLRRSDLHILRGPHFINDRLIEFFFAHLSAAAGGGDGGGGVLLVPPCISFLIPNIPDPTSLREILSPLRLPDRDLILFTVNDNADPAIPEGGSHWSLLAFDRLAGEFVHHDSFPPINHWPAESLYEAVKGHAGGNGARFVEGPTPQQKNGYDCGLYVMAAARAICEWYEGGAVDVEGRWLANLEEEAGKIGEMRGELLRLITDLMERQRRD